MNPVISKLAEWGCDVDCIRTRFLGDEGFYLSLLPMAVDEENINKLTDALKFGDVNAAFEAAHALKGAMGNMGLTVMFDAASEITEALRDRQMRDVSEPLARLTDARERLREIIAG